MKPYFLLFERIIILSLLVSFLTINSEAQNEINAKNEQAIDTSGFSDSAHHWYDIYDEDKLINYLSNRPKYKITEIEKIADNILLFQKTNGGWPKNYDMLAILTEEQKDTVQKAKALTNTTFDNGATHSQIEYLAEAYSLKRIERFKEGCLKGIDFMLSAQYPNGGWPQYYPDTSGYRKYITFNDGAMIGVMKVLQKILTRERQYSFVDSARYEKVREAFEKGIYCILKCQIKQNGKLTVWGQQHDNIDLHPQNARAFEPAALCGDESADIVLLLMSLDNPSKEVIAAIQSAIKWLYDSRILGTRVNTISAPVTVYKYSTSAIDRIVVKDPDAPPIWTRFYELGTNRPLFCNRDKITVYSLAEVDRERRSGYTWYHYEPERVFKKYPEWQRRWAADNNVLE
ncbi:MAG: pectate lyase [Ignavibacteriales bacterium]|nr:pectate lyase [Ignavibacteriales bacterium]